jgi:N-acetylornithine carbamoyltransferase
VQDVGRATWSLETRDGAVMDGDRVEHVKDAIGKFLSRAVHAIGVRAFSDLAKSYEENRDEPVLRAIAAAASVPVISLESANAHPMQGLADLLTLRRHLPDGGAVAVCWAYHPKPLPMAVPNTAVAGFARAGYDVRLVHPPGFELDDAVLARARGHGRVTVVHDLDEGVRGADVIYAKSWGARAEYGPDADRSARGGLRDWIIDGRRQALGAPAAFMHCLPVRRNVIVTDDVIDGPRSWVAEQAEARIWTQAAVLHEIL